MNLQPVFAVPLHVFGTPRLRANVVLRQRAPGGQDQREFARDFFFRSDILRDDETALATHEFVDVHGLGAGIRRILVAGPLHAAELVDLLVGDAPESGCQRGDLGHDLAWMRIVHRVTQRVGQLDRHFPVRQPCHRRHHFAHARNAALGIGEGAVFFKERGTGQEHMCVLGGFIEEDVLHHDALHRHQRLGHVLRVRVGLHDIFALAIQTQEAARDRSIEHVGNTQTGFSV